MFRHVTSATSWGEILDFDNPFFPKTLCPTLLPVPSTRIVVTLWSLDFNSIRRNLSKTLVGNGCIQFWASSRYWLKYLTSLFNNNSIRTFKAHPNRPLLNCTYCLDFVNESHA
ncbi:hypothetical protein M9H77_21904 [Catharanthus roseus]|uniref:Uncharacterized protein n=1 Tax=Catharanthus roseus TaxID=4058 RepID=A0ACC0AT04_CATRO|nr:hypothetical protein M9H77_21904 [Catharanthus roseus]